MMSQNVGDELAPGIHLHKGGGPRQPQVPSPSRASGQYPCRTGSALKKKKKPGSGDNNNAENDR